MRRPLARVVSRLLDARDRRSDPATADRLDAVLAVLRADHGQDAPDDDGDARLADVARVFRLTELDVELLLVAVAAELDANVSAAYGLLQGDPTRLRPSVGLALELCGAGSLSGPARGRLAPTAPLRRTGLVHVDGDAPLLARSLRADDRVVARLVGEDGLDPTVAAMLVPTQAVRFAATDPLARALEGGVALAWIHAPGSTAGLSLAAGAFDELGAGHLAVDLRRRPSAGALADALRCAVREAGLLGVGLVLAGADELVEQDATLLQVIERAPVPVVALAGTHWNAGWLNVLPYTADAPKVDVLTRSELWSEHVEKPAEDVDLPALLGLRLAPEEIVKTARHAAMLRAGGPVSAADLRASARLMSGGGLTGATRLRVTPSFDDLALPPRVLASLHELVGWAISRDEVLAQGAVVGKGDKGSGITALFAGSPGTGKTLAAQVVAGELGLDLYTVDLSTIVDKYIGETEKNLERVFSQAESLNVVLLFDEADALFGSRSEVKDARDRYANQEVAYLLQRMERFEGIAILATNLRGNLDTAFARRLQFVVHFPDPDEQTRRRLWAGHLSALGALDADDPVDVDDLAGQFEVAGGDIRNIVLASAYSAAADGSAVGMRHLVAAAHREYRKLGRRPPATALTSD